MALATKLLIHLAVYGCFKSSSLYRKIEKIEMGRACSKYGGKERCVEGSGGET
jgi:hypothetical protein